YRTIIISVAAVVVLVLLFVVFNPFKLQVTENSAGGSSENSLAVMYFENIPDPADKDHNSEMLTNLLITSLSQVKGLEVISRERLQEIQKDLGGTDTKSLSPSLAGQVAKHAGVTTMLIGSILQEKPMLAVTTRLIDVQSGKIMSSQQVTNFSVNNIFSLVDSLSNLIQTTLQVGSSEPGEIKSVADVTTKSPEAYRAYMEGIELDGKIYWKEASAAFLRAIDLDKHFAMAYYRLAFTQGAVGNVEASQQSLKKAVDLAENTTERERLQILAASYVQQNNLPKAIEIFNQLIERYPHEINSYVQLGYIVYARQMLEPERAVELYRRGLKVEPSAKTLWNLLAYSFAWLNKKQEALGAINSYVSLAPAEPNPYDTEGDIYAWFQEYDSSRASYLKAISLREDFGSAAKLGFDAVLGQQYTDAEKYFQSADFELPLVDAHRGLLQSAKKKLMGLPDSQISPGDRLMAMINYSCETGQYPEMLQLAEKLSSYLKKDPTNIIYGRDYLAWALIKNGKSTEAQRVLDDLQKDVRGGSPSIQVSTDYSS